MSFQPAMTGLFGKLPACGDFVRTGLPEDFVTAWDGWCREMMAACRETLGDGWLPAWLEAPIWRFLLPAGACGARAALGVWLPSVDKVGRQYPIVLCALADSVQDLCDGGAWADRAEAAGLDGVLRDAPHGDLAARLTLPADAVALPLPGWWTEGSPNVAPQRLESAGLIPPDLAAGMLRDLASAERG